MDNITTLEGPIENVAGKLMLRIPLAAGGQELLLCSRGISEIDGDFLNIAIPAWLAAQLKLAEGVFVIVDNRDGKLNMRRSERNE